MPSLSLDEKRKVLERRLQLKLKQYDRLNEKLDLTLDVEQGVVLEEKIDELWAEIEKLEEELKRLEISDSSNQRQRDLHLEKNFPKIDFKEATQTIQEITEKFGWGGGAAIFLIQNSLSMGGQWCAERIKEILMDKAGEFKFYPIRFLLTDRLDEFGLLDKLAPHFNLSPRQEDLPKYVQAVIQTMCESVRGGAVVFIELAGWDNLRPQERVLPWFLQNFWLPLVQDELPKITTQHSNVKFVTLILAETAFLNDLPHLTKSLCCPQDNFHTEKIFELKLPTNWSEDEILNWLGLYSGLPPVEVKQVAKKIYTSSANGMPPLVYKGLMEAFR